jgi:hypothetical protein
VINIANLGRPRIYDPEVLADKLDAYIEDTPEPLIQEFCLNENINKDTLYRLEKENKHLSDSMKKAIQKQEIYLVRNGSTGKVNPVFAIFRLKQPTFGYTDKADITLTAKQEEYDPAQLKSQLRDLLAELPEDEIKQLTE